MSIPAPDTAAADLPLIDIPSADIAASIDERGWAILPALLDQQGCAALIAMAGDDALFRSQIDMARYGFGRGHYGYFAYPLPPIITQLRARLYAMLAPLANGWAARLDSETRYPADHAAYLRACHAAGQTRPTPLLLRYGPGDYNCLHQDVYGALSFPLQVAVLLSDPQTDFSGGEFVLTEQRPRRQSRAEVVPLNRGDAVVFAVNHRPVRGNGRDYRVTMRHGVSTIRTGKRHTLGIIFHDAS